MNLLLQNLPDPHEVEKVAMEWIGVTTAVATGIIIMVGILWGRWKSTMKDLLDNHADKLNEKKGKHDTHTRSDS